MLLRPKQLRLLLLLVLRPKQLRLVLLLLLKPKHLLLVRLWTLPLHLLQERCSAWRLRLVALRANQTKRKASWINISC